MDLKQSYKLLGITHYNDVFVTKVKVIDNYLMNGFTLKQHHIRKMRIRNKECFNCKNQKEVLYRCRYNEFKDWVFLCGTCLTKIKSQHENTYQYGGTWKIKKK